jgi:glycerol-3-phosphate acyltransferase PlsY
MHYLHLQMPQRGRLYIAIGVWLIVIYIFALFDVPLLVTAVVCVLLSAAGWSIMSRPAAGMEIDGGVWRVFVGSRRWEIPLSAVASVSLARHRDRVAGLVVHFRDGRTARLPKELSPRAAPLEKELARRGIPVTA